MPDDYYDLLQVPPNAPQELIDRAYRLVVRLVHPDVFPRDDTYAQEWALERMKLINEAYQALRDPATRLEYDSRRGASVGSADQDTVEGQWGDAKPEESPSEPDPIAWVRNIEAAIWFSMARWARERNLMNGKVRHFLFEIGRKVSNGWTVTPKQAAWAQQIFNSLLDHGYDVTSDTRRR